MNENDGSTVRGFDPETAPDLSRDGWPDKFAKQSEKGGPQAVSIDTTFLHRCIASLERAVESIEKQEDREDVMYDIYRAACVKGFELVLGQSGRLLRRRLAASFVNSRQADRLHFKDLFRQAARYELVDWETAERWLRYRDNLDDATRNSGEDFAEATLNLLPDFIDDARALADMIERKQVVVAGGGQR